MRVLVFCRLPDLARCYATLLAAWGHHATPVGTLLAAVQATDDARPDVILCDGESLSRDALDDIARLAIQLGAAVIAVGDTDDGYCPFPKTLNKPLDPAELRARLASAADRLAFSGR